MKRVTEIITPERAKQLLSTYPHVYKVNRFKVERLKVKMLSGKWVIDDGSFMNIRAGKLVNGKHRMTAIMESGITEQMRVQYDN